MKHFTSRVYVVTRFALLFSFARACVGVVSASVVFFRDGSG